MLDYNASIVQSTSGRFNPCMLCGGLIHSFHHSAAGGGFLRLDQRHVWFAQHRIEEQFKSVRPCAWQVCPGGFAIRAFNVLALEIKLAVGDIGVALCAAEDDA